MGGCRQGKFQMAADSAVGAVELLQPRMEGGLHMAIENMILRENTLVPVE